jgi:hypothetical protein
MSDYSQNQINESAQYADAYFRLIATGLRNSGAFWKENLPLPKTAPVTLKIVESYLACIALLLPPLDSGSQAVLELVRRSPGLFAGYGELLSWIRPCEPDTLNARITEQNEDDIGDVLTKQWGFPYSLAKDILRRGKTPPKGAPNKRVHTLKMLDARAVYGWSYNELAAKMCDCGGRTHDSLCQERIRKRLKEIKPFLTKHGIAFPEQRRKVKRTFLRGDNP